MRLKLFVALAAMSVLLGFVPAKSPAFDLPHIPKIPGLGGSQPAPGSVFQVAPGILRGPQPSTETLTALRNQGVKTIIDLRMSGPSTMKESHTCQKLGLNFVHIPMIFLKSPSKRDISQFLSLVENPANQPVFIHCMEGRDRTGAMVGMYRIHAQGWNADQAYDEMKKMGFHTAFTVLADSVYEFGESVGRPGHRTAAIGLQNRVDRTLGLDTMSTN